MSIYPPINHGILEVTSFPARLCRVAASRLPPTTMRRGVGVSGLQREQSIRDQYKQVGQALSASQLEHVREQMTLFKQNLETFAVKYRKEIQHDPYFRAQFQQMCAKIGVDTLASSKGFWAEILGYGDFYYELAIQVIDVCIATRPLNGGLIELDQCRAQVEKHRSGSAPPISSDDIVRAVKSLKPLGQGFELIEVGHKKMIQSVPLALNTDHLLLLAAAEKGGSFTLTVAMNTLGSSQERANMAIEHLIQEALVWVDEQAPLPEYWASSAITEASI